MMNPARLLFVGNSFTFRNDLPTLIQQMAPVSVEWQTIVAGGASLRQHINSGAVKNALESENWLYVILQEQSTLPIKSPARFSASVRELDEIIRARKAKTVLYQTWARQNSPETQEVLSANYANLAEELNAILVPVGDAWKRALDVKPNSALRAPLYDADGSHPSPAGSYLAACVFVATLWQQNPVGLPVPESLKISADDATLLQKLAWQVAQK